MNKWWCFRIKIAYKIGISGWTTNLYYIHIHMLLIISCQIDFWFQPLRFCNEPTKFGHNFSKSSASKNIQKKLFFSEPRKEFQWTHQIHSNEGPASDHIFLVKNYFKIQHISDIEHCTWKSFWAWDMIPIINLHLENRET